MRSVMADLQPLEPNMVSIYLQIAPEVTVDGLRSQYAEFLSQRERYTNQLAAIEQNVRDENSKLENITTNIAKVTEHIQAYEKFWADLATTSTPKLTRMAAAQNENQPAV